MNLEVDRPRVIASVVALTAVISAMLLMAPVVVGALITGLRMTPQQAGMTISAELGAMSLAAIPALWWVPVAPWRGVLMLSLSLMIVGNLFCTSVTDFPTLCAARFMTGLAGGSVMVICLAVIGASRDTERNFGWWTVGQLALGAAGLAVLPRALPAVGLKGLYAALAVLLATCMISVRWMPAGASVLGVRATSRASIHWRPATLGLAAILAFYIALSGLWTYIERIGAVAGLAAAQIADDLTIASVFGIAGCLCAALLGSRLGRRWPTIAGYGVMIASIAALTGLPSPLRYAAAACGFKYAWTFTLPFILASLAAQDLSGRVMALANLMIGCGLAIGPAIVASLLGTPPAYDSALELGIGGAAVSLVLLLAGLRLNQPALAVPR